MYQHTHTIALPDIYTKPHLQIIIHEYKKDNGNSLIFKAHWFKNHSDLPQVNIHSLSQLYVYSVGVM